MVTKRGLDEWDGELMDNMPAPFFYTPSVVVRQPYFMEAF
jgi:hypothetical protein